MSRMILFLFVAVLLFSLAAGASWYLQQRHAQELDQAKAGDDKAAKSVSHAPAAKGTATDALPGRAVSRPPASADPDRVAQAALTLQRQQESLKNREQFLETREKQMNLIHDDIKKEHKKLDIVRKEIQAELQLVQDKLELLEKKSSEVDTKRQQITQQVNEFDAKRIEVSGTEAANLKKLATIYDKMDPEAAAQGIEQMVEKGKIEMAVAILSNMNQRQAAGLLSEISKGDPGIAIQLLDRMRFLKTSLTSPK